MLAGHHSNRKDNAYSSKGTATASHELSSTWITSSSAVYNVSARAARLGDMIAWGIRRAGSKRMLANIM